MTDRTIIGGKPGFTEIPGQVIIDKKMYKVIGISQGIKLPYMSLELEKTTEKLVGKLATI